MPLGIDVPHYASNKYRDTLALLEKAKNLKDGVEKKGISLGPFEGPRFKQYYEALSMKEQVLGYLEDMTNGKVQQEELHPDEFRLYTDWILSDTPEAQFPTETKSRAYARAQWLRGYISNASDEGKAKRDVLRSLYLESRPEIKLDEVENLVLAGGGAKALSLAGVVRSLESHDRSEQIKRVAGTSGGAIIAMAYAMGYDANELESLVNDNEFGLFTLGSNFDLGIMNQWAHHFCNGEKKNKAKLHVLSDNSLAHTYHKNMMQAMAEHLATSTNGLLVNVRNALQGVPKAKLGKQLERVFNHLPNKDAYYHSVIRQIPISSQIEIDNQAKEMTEKAMNGPLSTIRGISLYKTPAAAMIGAMRHRTGQDLVRGFFSDLVYDKLKTYPPEVLREVFYGPKAKHDTARKVSQQQIRDISFSQWQRLHELLPDRVKELHISMSILRPAMARLKSLNHFKHDPYEHQSASHEHDEFKDMPVVDAVRVSMNLPPIYQRYKFTVNGKQYKGSDGGIKSNMSLATFDDKYDTNQTIGVFYKTGKELRAAVDVNRMLVIPRSANEIKRELTMWQAADKELKEEIEQLKENIKSCHLPYDPNLEAERGYQSLLKKAVDDRREVGGRIAAQQEELTALSEIVGSPVKKWLTDPKGQLGHLMSRYLDKKSTDQLGRSHNLRRLVMINTHDIETWHFKMSGADKSMQLRYGDEAMDSLLNGTYCLENHFYQHHFSEITEKLLEHNIELYMENQFEIDFQKHGVSHLAQEMYMQDNTIPQHVMSIEDCVFEEDQAVKPTR